MRCYSRYLKLRSQGLRQEAFNSLREFVSNASNWPLAERQSFLLWLDQRLDSQRAEDILEPYPLKMQVSVPTSVEWLRAEPDSAQANYFYAIYVVSPEREARKLAHLRKALRDNPRHQGTLNAILTWLAHHVNFSQHELPIGYLGSVKGDLAKLKHGMTLVDRIENAEKRQHFVGMFSEQIRTAQAWIKFRKSELPSDPESWRDYLQHHKVIGQG